MFVEFVVLFMVDVFGCGVGVCFMVLFDDFMIYMVMVVDVVGVGGGFVVILMISFEMLVLSIFLF